MVKFVSCILTGGLGNQLFQIFATIAYSIQHKHRCIFPREKNTPGVTYRTTYWTNFLSTLSSFTTFQNNMMTNSEIYRMPRISHPHHHYTEIPPNQSNGDVCLHGYFQSYKYFESYKSTIFSLLKIENQRQIVKKEYTEYFTSEKDKLHLISMHFRIGDYMHLQTHHNILLKTYYENALQYIVNIENSRQTKVSPDTSPIANREPLFLYRVIVFYEEKDYKKVCSIIDYLQIIYPEIEFVYINTWIEDWKQMLLMSNCHSNIIANSTFSWWGAYFNSSAKHVCYPEKWFGPALSTNHMGDMFPSTWVSIKE
jgi:hypothetical protein